MPADLLAYDRWLLDAEATWTPRSRMHLGPCVQAWGLHLAGLDWRSAILVEHPAQATHTITPSGQVLDGAHPGHGCLVAAVSVAAMEAA